MTFTLPSVCLNYGVRTPESHDRFHLMDVNDYTADPRARKALRGLATYGTSRMVAQAVAWHLFNGIPLQQLAMQDIEPFNAHELVLAARIIEAIDAAGPDGTLDPSAFRRGRIFAQIHGEPALSKQAAKLTEEFAGRSILGLPVDVLAESATLSRRARLAPQHPFDLDQVGQDVRPRKRCGGDFQRRMEQARRRGLLGRGGKRIIDGGIARQRGRSRDRPEFRQRQVRAQVGRCDHVPHREQTPL